MPAKKSVSSNKAKQVKKTTTQATVSQRENEWTSHSFVNFSFFYSIHRFNIRHNCPNYN
jgi:hypothetical protein